MNKPYFVCECGKEFTNFFDTRATMHTSSGNKVVWEFTCDICGVTYLKPVVIKEVNENQEKSMI